MRVGFIGMGNMGVPMAANLLKAGHDVAVYDVDAERVKGFVARHGGKGAATAADLADREFIVTMLPNGKVVREVYFGSFGLAKALSRGAIAIDMSSADPAGSRALGAELAKLGIALVDAPVSGAVPRATTGTLAIMIGADDDAARERAKGVLSAMGDRLFDTGGLGTGHAMKALNNFVAAAGYSAAVEALLAGRRFGLDPARMLAIMNSSTGRNFNTEVVLQEHVVNERYATGFSLGLLAKDVGIAADVMRTVKLDAPMAMLIEQRYLQALAQLGPQRDNSEAILAWNNDNKE
jgi:3-hydroxyisobutyrate dehydrogenase